MTIAYYHGAPGSYKTASMVKDWLIPALKSGRPVLTNIRGVKPSDNVKVVPASKIVEEMFLVENGTLILIDELGQSFKDFDEKKYKAPASNLKSDENGVIETIDNIMLLGDKHRHFNLDIIGTAPSIKRVPAFFRVLSEFGYKHKNLASLGFGGWYIQGEHMGEETGGAESHFTKKMIKRMPKSVFKLYQSTSTGKAKDSAISTPFYKHPLFVSLTLFMFLGGLYVYNNIKSGKNTFFNHGQSSIKTGVNTSSNADIKVNTDNKKDSINSDKINKANLEYNKVDYQKTNATVAFLFDDKAYLVKGVAKFGNSKYFFIGNCEKTITVYFDDNKPSSVGFKTDGKRIYYNDVLIPESLNHCEYKDNTDGLKEAGNAVLQSDTAMHSNGS